MYLVKTDADGRIVWSRTYGGPENETGYSVLQTADGGYIIAGAWDGASLIKIDWEGTLVWRRTYGGPGSDWGSSVRQTADDGFIIAGGTTSYGAGQRDVYLVKTDPDGRMLWNRTYGGPHYDAGQSVQQTTDGGYIIVGGTASFGEYDPGDVYMTKIDLEGQVLWNRTYGGSSGDVGYSVQQTTDGGYIITGETSSFDVDGNPDSDVYLIKTDQEGRLIWDRTYGGSNADGGQCVQQTTDGGYIIAGGGFNTIDHIETRQSQTVMKRVNDMVYAIGVVEPSIPRGGASSGTARAVRRLREGRSHRHR